DRILKLQYPGLGLLVIVLVTILIGALAGNFAGRRVFALTEKLFTKAPIVRIVYSAIKDLLEAFVGNKRRFDRPVAITVSEGVKTFGFITRDDLASLGCRATLPCMCPSPTRGTGVCSSCHASV
ncbi:MAG TPA: DUF502 domain-containing protein, partial [Vicinamibacterales bacterium]